MRNKGKIIDRLISYIFMIVIIPTLFVTSRWVSKSLIIQSVIESNQEEIQSKDKAPVIIEETTDQEKYEKITKEDVLKHLKSKYKEDFEILEYSDGGILSYDTLQVYPTSGNDLTDVFDISRQQDGSFTDNYLNIYARKRVAQVISSICTKELNGQSWYIRVNINSIQAESKEDADTKGMEDLAIEAEIDLMIPWSEDTEEGYAAQKLKSISSEIGRQGIVGVIRLKEMKLNNFSTLNDSTYSQYDKMPYRKSMYKEEIAEMMHSPRESGVDHEVA